MYRFLHVISYSVCNSHIYKQVSGKARIFQRLLAKGFVRPGTNDYDSSSIVKARIGSRYIMFAEF